MTELTSYMTELGRNARTASRSLRLASHDDRNAALTMIANAISDHREQILSANAADIESGKEKGLNAAMLDRLKLDPARLSAISESLRAIAALPDPIGTVDEKWTQPNALKFERIRIPIGVIGMIYESRPNVTVDAAGLCLKSGNACILRGGSESLKSNHALHAAILDGISASPLSGLPVQLINTVDRDAVGLLLGGLGGNVDMIIPRGGKGLVARVQSDARVPVLSHLDGLCHTYIHKDADLNKAKSIILNAKMRRTGICGATETLLVDREISAEFLPELLGPLADAGCEIRAGHDAIKLSPEGTIAASETDFATEHLAPVINVRVVDDIADAFDHIDQFGSGHTDAIVTENVTAAERFIANVDSAIVMHNTSTQFADGGEFGFGAEIGIATGRLHARGPVGARHLTTYKYAVRGNGQTRP